MQDTDARLAAQDRLLDNISDNVKSGKFTFAGGRRRFEEWNARATASTNSGERQALLKYNPRPIDPDEETKPRVQIILHKRVGEWTWTLSKVGFRGHPTPKPVESSREFGSRAAALQDAEKICSSLGYACSSAVHRPKKPTQP